MTGFVYAIDNGADAIKIGFASRKAEIDASNAAYRSAHKAEAAAYRVAHKAKAAAYRVAHKAEAAACGAAHYAAHKAEACARGVAYYAAHKADACAYKAAYCAANPEKVRVHKHTRRARKAGAEGRFTAEDVKRIRCAQKDKCAVCRIGLKGRGHRDHIISLAAGGSNWPTNIQLLCGSCNHCKGAKDPIAFMQSLGLLL
jgi:5-methylcytosine-specific restriction endonuclease McrA